MVLTREKKTQIISDLEDLFKDSAASIASDYSSLEANQVTILRKKMAKAGIKLIVTKNTLVKKAMTKLDLELSDELLSRPIIFAFGEDEVETAKLISEFAKEYEALEILGGVVRGEVADESKIKVLSLLPSRAELQGKLVGILAAPTYGLVNVLHGNIRGLVSVLDQYKSKLSN